jgi:hypothetical protein
LCCCCLVLSCLVILNVLWLSWSDFCPCLVVFEIIPAICIKFFLKSLVSPCIYIYTPRKTAFVGSSFSCLVFVWCVFVIFHHNGCILLNGRILMLRCTGKLLPLGGSGNKKKLNGRRSLLSCPHPPLLGSPTPRPPLHPLLPPHVPFVLSLSLSCLCLVFVLSCLVLSCLVLSCLCLAFALYDSGGYGSRV